MPGFIDAAGGELVAVSASADAAGCLKATCPAATATTVKNAPGLLKGVWVAGTGTAGTVAVADGGSTYFTAQVPASATSFALPLPVEGVAHGTSIVVTTVGAGVTAAAFYV